MESSTPTAEISHALAAALDLTTLVHQTVNGLLGVQPEPSSGKSSGAEISPDGILPRMASSARYTTDQIFSAVAALRRLQAETDQAVNDAVAPERGYAR